MPLKSALLRDFGGCCFCNTIRACFLWLLEVTIRTSTSSIKNLLHICYMQETDRVDTKQK